MLDSKEYTYLEPWFNGSLDINAMYKYAVVKIIHI